MSLHRLVCRQPTANLPEIVTFQGEGKYNKEKHWPPKEANVHDPTNKAVFRPKNKCQDMPNSWQIHQIKVLTSIQFLGANNSTKCTARSLYQLTAQVFLVISWQRQTTISSANLARRLPTEYKQSFFWSRLVALFTIVFSASQQNFCQQP